MLESLKELSYQYWSVYKKTISKSFSYSQNISSQEMQYRIEIVIADVIQQVLSTGNIELSFINSSKSVDYDIETGTNRISSSKISSLRLSRSKSSVAHLLKVLEIVYNLHRSGLKATKREVFYMAVDLFKSQSKSDKAIEHVCNLLEVPRNRLNILGAGKGLLSGSISYMENSVQSQVGSRIVKIPTDVDSLSSFETSADYLLVLEKDTVLSRLVQESFFEENNCIGLTGCGYPDLHTREFIRRIINEFSWIPVFIMTDFDPHGFKILCTYTFGSVKLSGECDNLAVPFAHWIGVHYGEGFLNLPLNWKDLKLLDKLMNLPQVNAPPSNYQQKRFRLWRMQLEEMKENNAKCEIEGTWEGELKGYIEYKISNGSWI